MAVYHRGRGVWKIKDQFTLQFGSDGDLPVAADFDRDGRADPALFRRATGTWLIHGTAAQLSLTVAGNAFGDSPALMRPYLAYGATTDFTADGWNDLVWLHQDGRIAIWQMNGTTLMGGTVVASRVSDFQWRIVGAADFNRDTHPDLLWQHADGRVAIWLMNGTALIEGRVVTQASDTRWRIGGTGDLDGDGHVDIVWQHPDGRVVAWLMNGTTLMRATQVTQVGDPDWLLAGAGDANGDGKLDLFWHHRTLGHVVIWIMNGTALVTGRLANGNVKDPNWRIVGAGDVNGDAQPDLVWQNQNGYAVAWIMDGENMTRGAALMPSMPSDNRWRLMAPR
jgi:hypothetical protein